MEVSRGLSALCLLRREALVDSAAGTRRERDYVRLLG